MRWFDTLVPLRGVVWLYVVVLCSLWLISCDEENVLGGSSGGDDGDSGGGSCLLGGRVG